MTADCKINCSAHQIIQAKKNKSLVSHLDFPVLAFGPNWKSSLKDIKVWNWVKTDSSLNFKCVNNGAWDEKAYETGTISHAVTKQDPLRTPWRNGSIAEMTGTQTSGSLGGSTAMSFLCVYLDKTMFTVAIKQSIGRLSWS